MKPLITFCRPDLSGKIAPICGTMDSYIDDGRRSLEAIKQSAQEELKRRNAKSKAGYARFVIYDAISSPWRTVYKTHEEIED